MIHKKTSITKSPAGLRIQAEARLGVAGSVAIIIPQHVLVVNPDPRILRNFRIFTPFSKAV